jgi:hypothetical protein
MVKILQRAISEAAALPDSDQDRIGRQLFSYIEKLRSLRTDLDKGANSLDEGKGSVVDIDDFVRRKSD